MHLHETADLLDFEYSWFKVKYLIALIAAPLFAFFLVNSEYVVGGFDQLTFPVIVLFVACLIVMYYCLAKVLNSTKISVTHEELDVRHGPLFFGRNIHLKKGDISQLFVTRHRIGHRYYLYSTTYQINVILADEEVITLVKGLHLPEQGRFIEHKIEDFLNITDIHVEGELEKD